MQTTSDSPPPKRTRAKAKSDSAQPTVTVKKSRARKTAPAPEPTPAAVQIETTDWNAEQVASMIATAAYFLAEERGFTPGHELDDWLEAERRIRVLCFG